MAIEKGKVYHIISAANIDGCIEEGFTINTNIAIHSMLNNFWRLTNNANERDDEATAEYWVPQSLF